MRINKTSTFKLTTQKSPELYYSDYFDYGNEWTRVLDDKRGPDFDC